MFWLGTGTGRILMRADDRGVHRDIPVDLTCRVGRGLDLLEKAFPGSVSRPKAMAFLNGLPRPEPFGQVTPLNSGPHPVQDPVDHLPVIPPPATTTVFVTVLARHRMIGSMGRVGAACDNAAVESFFALLQKNVLDRRTWATRQELRIAIVTWIERTYHRRRRQKRLVRLTPVEYETIMTPPAALAA